MPTYRHHGLIGMAEGRVVSERRRVVFRLPNKFQVIPIPHLIDSHLEPVHPDAMQGPFFVLALFASHPKLTRRNQPHSGHWNEALLGRLL